MVELKGSLMGIGLAAIVQLIGELQHSGTLELTRGAARGVLSFVEGRLVSATFDDLQGFEALAACTQELADGEFTFIEGAPGGERTLDLSPRELRSQLSQLAIGEKSAPPAPHADETEEVQESEIAICPLLGFADDPTRHYSRSTALHRCYSGGLPSLVTPQEQRELCLAGRYPTCARFRNASATPAGGNGLNDGASPPRPAAGVVELAAPRPPQPLQPQPAEPQPLPVRPRVYSERPRPRIEHDEQDEQEEYSGRPRIPRAVLLPWLGVLGVVLIVAVALVVVLPALSPKAPPAPAAAPGFVPAPTSAPTVAAARVTAVPTSPPTLAPLPASAASKPTPASGRQVAPTAGPAATPAPTVAPALPTLPTTVTSKPAAGTGPFPSRPTSSAGPRSLIDVRFAAGMPTDWLDNAPYAAWSDGAYRLQARQAAHYVAVAAPVGESLADVVVSATFRKTGGPPGGGYGLVVRDQGPEPRDGVSQNMRAYVLAAGDLGEFGIWRRDGDHWIDMVPWTRTSAVRFGGSPNDLTVRAIGDQLSFTVNGVEVANLQDPALADGKVGVFVGGDYNEVALDRFAVQVPN